MWIFGNLGVWSMPPQSSRDLAGGCRCGHIAMGLAAGNVSSVIPGVGCPRADLRTSLMTLRSLTATGDTRPTDIGASTRPGPSEHGCFGGQKTLMSLLKRWFKRSRSDAESVRTPFRKRDERTTCSRVSSNSLSPLSVICTNIVRLSELEGTRTTKPFCSNLVIRPVMAPVVTMQSSARSLGSKR